MTDKPIDWTAEIVIQATDWQGELPARVVSGPDEGGDYLVAIEALHRIYAGGAKRPAGERLWFTPGGIGYGFPDIRVINKQSRAMIEAGAA